MWSLSNSHFCPLKCLCLVSYFWCFQTLKCLCLVSYFWCFQMTFRFTFTNLCLIINITLNWLCFIHIKLRYKFSIRIDRALNLLTIVFHFCVKHIWNNYFCSLKLIWIVKIKFRLLFFVLIHRFKSSNILIYCLNQLGISSLQRWIIAWERWIIVWAFQ